MIEAGSERVFEGGLTLTETAIEWTSATGQSRWMPFACMRRIGFGHGHNGGRSLRISGPPGVLWLKEDTLGAADFDHLAKAALAGASGCGCGPVIRRGGVGPGWLWARSGKRVESTVAMRELQLT